MAKSRELIRVTLVEVDGERVNQAHPYFEMDSWSGKLFRYAQAAFIELNGVEDDDIKNFLAGAEVIPD